MRDPREIELLRRLLPAGRVIELARNCWNKRASDLMSYRFSLNASSNVDSFSAEPKKQSVSSRSRNRWFLR